MKKILLSLLFTFVSFTMFSQNSKTFTPSNYVMDLGDLYTPEQELQLNQIISDYEKKTSIEIGILTVDSLNGETIEDFAYEQFNRLGIGKAGANNGLLLVFSLKDRKSRVEVGAGMEPFTTDQTTHESLQLIKPYFRAGDYFTGTNECLSYIIKDLGNEAFVNRVKWLKEKEAKEAKEAAISAEKARTTFMYIAICVAVFGTLFFIYWIDRKNKELKANIKKAEESFNKFEINTPTITSKILNSNYSSVTNFYNQLSLNGIYKKSKNKNIYLNNLLFELSVLNDKKNTYNNMVSDISQNIENIKNMNVLLTLVKNYNTNALLSDKAIEKFGYKSEYTDISSNIEKITPLVLSIKELLKNDVDNAIVEYKKFKVSCEALMNRCKLVSDKLTSIENARRSVENSESSISGLLRNVATLKSFQRSSDNLVISNITTKTTEFNSLKKTSTDYLMLSGVLLSLLKLIESLYSTLLKRKRDKEEEEEAERRRKRASEAAAAAAISSSYSNSTSSTSSDFGGFGGGSSFGGGASDGW